MKFKVLSLIVLSLLAACQPAKKAEPEPRTALASTTVEATSVVSSISPDRLKIGNLNAPRCAEVVTVQNPEVACQQNDCTLKVFHSELMAIEEGQRAVRVFDCENGSNQPQLLTDREPRFNSTAVLLLQNTREGENLWRQLQDENEYKIEFATEAADGVLALNSQGGYEWSEIPD